MLPERHKVHACCVPGSKSACAAPDKDIKLQGRFNGQAGMLFWQPRNTSDTEVCSGAAARHGDCELEVLASLACST